MGDNKKERNRSLKVKIFLLISVISISYLASIKFIYGGNLEIIVFDVGQGDSILIKTPNNKKILIDGGPNEKVIEKIPLDPPLFTCNIDVVLSTHSHSDHITGLEHVLQRCSVSLLIANDVGLIGSDPKGSDPNAGEFGPEGLIRHAYAGDSFEVDSVTFNILWPREGYVSGDLNNLSIVVLMEYNSFKALFTGDAESEFIGRVIDEDIDLLKAPHHGSYDEGLEEFLLRVRPEIIAVSVGKNSFGHPSSQILGAADNANIHLYRTDLDGDVRVVVSSEGNYWVER